MKYKKYLCFSSKVTLILFVAFALYYSFCWYNVRIIHDGKENQMWKKEHYLACEKYMSTNDDSEKEKIVSSYNYLGINDDVCNQYISYGVLPDSAFNTFEEFLTDENYLFPFFIPIIVLLPFIYLISREMKNKVVKNFCLRKSYKEYIVHIFKTAYKNLFTIPIVVGITFIISYIVSNGNMNPKADLGFNYILPNLQFIDNPIFPFIYFLTLFLGVGLYINIGLIVLSKNKNFIIALLESELSIFLIWCLSLIGFGRLFKSIFNINPDNFNLLSLYDWSNVDNMYLYFIVNLFLFIITFAIAILSYKDKEKIISMCEK